MKKAILIPIALIAAAGLGGYLAGRSSRAALQATVMTWLTPPSAADDPLSATDEGTLSGAAARHARVKKLKERFHALWSSVEYRNGDWETARECQRLLAQLSTEELADYCRASVDDRDLRGALLDEWVLRDGPAAMDTAVHLFDDKVDIQRSMWIWSSRDPEAVIAWMRQAEIPSHHTDAASHVRVNLLMDLAAKDFSRAEKELPYMEKPEKEWLLQWLAIRAGTDPEKTARVKEIAAQYSPSSAAEIEKAGFRAMVARDPEAAAKHLEGMGLTGRERAEMETTYLEGMSGRGVGEAYQAWMAVRDPAVPIPERVWEGFNSNFIFKPEETRRWLDIIPPGPERDAFYEHSIQHLAAHGAHDKAAAYTATIEDSAIRTAALKTLQRMWTEANPEAAKSWQESLPDHDRQSLQP
jgi:hypothetical protein